MLQQCCNHYTLDEFRHHKEGGFNKAQTIIIDGAEVFLKSNGVLEGRKPTPQELVTIRTLTLTSDEVWDPRTLCEKAGAMQSQCPRKWCEEVSTRRTVIVNDNHVIDRGRNLAEDVSYYPFSEHSELAGFQQAEFLIVELVDHK